MGKDNHYFDYDYDSDDDWEEEEQVIAIHYVPVNGTVPLSGTQLQSFITGQLVNETPRYLDKRLFCPVNECPDNGDRVYRYLQTYDNISFNFITVIKIWSVKTKVILKFYVKPYFSTSCPTCSIFT